MKIKLKDIEFERKHGYIYMDGKYYEMKGNSGASKFEFVEVKDVQERIDKAEEIADELVKSFNGKAVLVESIMKMPKSDIKTLYRNAITKKYKVKTREHHCVDMKVGNFVLPIVD